MHWRERRDISIFQANILCLVTAIFVKLMGREVHKFHCGHVWLRQGPKLKGFQCSSFLQNFYTHKGLKLSELSKFKWILCFLLSCYFFFLLQEELVFFKRFLCSLIATEFVTLPVATKDKNVWMKKMQ